MKRTTGIILLLSICGMSSLHAQTASFNFSAAAATVSGWTNIHGDPSVSTLNATSNGITISSLGATHWSPIPGVGSAYDALGASPGTFFPTGVLANHWFQYSSLGAYNALLPQFEISGLNKDSVYQLKMTGSSTTATVVNPTQYSVAGLTIYGSIGVNNHNNTSAGATFNNISPDTSGKIRVFVNTVPGTDAADICGLQIIRGHTAPPPVVTITSPANNDVIAEDGNVNVTATASVSGSTIVKVQFFVGDTTKIGESTTAPYAATWLNPDEGHYKLTATAIDANGNSNSYSINVSVESLSGYWSMTGNIRANADSNFLGTVDTNRLAFRTNNIERVSILKDGTVGIGTKNTQGYLLAVNGTAMFTKVKIKPYANWPDYVFKKDYHLPDLKELEQFITQHQHLPGIVPENEVQKDGIDVAAHEAALLKKIEELTLYLIRQNARLEQQQKEIDQLKKMVKTKK